MSEYQVADRKDSRALTEFLSREGQILLPMVQLVLIGVSVATWRSLRAVRRSNARAGARFGSIYRPLQKGA